MANLFDMANLSNSLGISDEDKRKLDELTQKQQMLKQRSEMHKPTPSPIPEEAPSEEQIPIPFASAQDAEMAKEEIKPVEVPKKPVEVATPEDKAIGVKIDENQKVMLDAQKNLQKAAQLAKLVPTPEEPKKEEEKPIDPSTETPTTLEELKKIMEVSKKQHEDRINKAKWLDMIMNVSNQVRAASGLPQVKSPGFEEAASKASLSELQGLMDRYKAAKQQGPKTMLTKSGVLTFDEKTGEAKFIKPEGMESEISELEKQRLEKEKAQTEYYRSKTTEQESRVRERDELKASQEKAIAGNLSLISKLNKLVDSPKIKEIGPIQGRMEETFRLYGGTDGDRAAYQARAGRILADYMKQISGAAISDKEVARLSRVIPNVRMTPEVFKAVAESFIQDLNMDITFQLDTAEANGQRVDNLRKLQKRAVQGELKDTQIPKNLSEIKRRTKDGRTAVFDTATKKFLRYEE